MVRDENLKFMRNRDVYNSDYFNFTLSLASVNAVSASRTLLVLVSPSLPAQIHITRDTCVCVCVCVLQTKLKHPDYQAMAKESLQLSVHFLFHTYLHTKK